jgi:hypothetical protein
VQAKTALERLASLQEQILRIFTNFFRCPPATFAWRLQARENHHEGQLHQEGAVPAKSVVISRNEGQLHQEGLVPAQSVGIRRRSTPIDHHHSRTRWKTNLQDSRPTRPRHLFLGAPSIEDECLMLQMCALLVEDRPLTAKAVEGAGVAAPKKARKLQNGVETNRFFLCKRW